MEEKIRGFLKKLDSDPIRWVTFRKNGTKVLLGKRIGKRVFPALASNHLLFLKFYLLIRSKLG